MRASISTFDLASGRQADAEAGVFDDHVGDQARAGVVLPRDQVVCAGMQSTASALDMRRTLCVLLAEHASTGDPSTPRLFAPHHLPTVGMKRSGPRQAA